MIAPSRVDTSFGGQLPPLIPENRRPLTKKYLHRPFKRALMKLEPLYNPTDTVLSPKD